MGALSINNGDIVTNKGNMPSIDHRYGPYASVAAAHAALAEDELCAVGLTVGILDGNTIVEYWYQGGTTQAHLVPKQSGSVPSMTAVPHSGATPASFEVSGGEYHTFSDAVDALTFTLGTDNPYAESQLEFATSANFTGVTWPAGCKFANQEPLLVADSTYLVTVLHGIVAVTEVVANGTPL